MERPFFCLGYSSLGSRRWRELLVSVGVHVGVQMSFLTPVDAKPTRPWIMPLSMMLALGRIHPCFQIHVRILACVGLLLVFLSTLRMQMTSRFWDHLERDAAMEPSALRPWVRLASQIGRERI
jgi:hypothetical protein